MKKASYSLFILIVSGLIYSCSNVKTAVDMLEQVNLDTVEVKPITKIEDYQASEKRINDIIHTKLEVSFNWDSAFLYGKAYLDIKPHFYPTDSLILDAKGYQIHEVALMDKIGKKSSLKYSYDSMYISIALPKTYTRKDTYRVFIDYTAMPNKLEEGGSSAITSDKGLYFINHDGSDPKKPKQIWTQGETEASSCWFPTIDAPNEKTTQEIYITVDSNYVTLSNGALMFQTENEDGTRTDYWKQDLPHAPYLFMMAIGEFAVVKDEWKGKPVHYYVEPEYEKYARDIYPNTVEMLEFFSKKLNYEYPWDKYHQVVVRDYVSGAMENTGAVIFGEFIQGDDRFLVDNAAEDIVAHEMFHHWFGDLVTCESWSNLPLNESFATYGEYLWSEHKYGKYAADLVAMNDLRAYMNSSRINKKKLVRFQYEHREEMFDAHSYQKGGRILHMLRDHVGDEAFFEALTLYLNTKKYQTAEVHDLRLAFESVTGEDLNWFFNQWFLGAGHPIIEVSKNYIDSLKTLEVTVKQSQEGEGIPSIFELYTNIGIADKEGEFVVHPIHVVEKEQTFSFKMEAEPTLVNLDVDKVIVGQIDQAIDKEAGIALYKHATNYMDKRQAIELLKRNKSEEAIAIVEEALNQEFWGLRARGIRNIKNLAKAKPDKVFDKLMEMATKDENSSIRAAAIGALGKYFEDKLSNETLVNSTKDISYAVVSQALNTLYEKDKEEGLKLAKSFESEENSSVSSTVANIYAEDGSSEFNNYFVSKIEELSGFNKYPMLLSYNNFLGKQSSKAIEESLPLLEELSTSDEHWFIRMAPINGMVSINNKLKKEIEDKESKIGKDINATEKGQLNEEIAEAKNLKVKIVQTLEGIKAKEENENVLRIIEQGLN